MYMPGRLRTASKPSSLSILEASYFSAPSEIGAEVSLSITSVSLAIKDTGRRVGKGVQFQLKNCKPRCLKHNSKMGLFSRANTISCRQTITCSQHLAYRQNL